MYQFPENQTQLDSFGYCNNGNGAGENISSSSSDQDRQILDSILNEDPFLTLLDLLYSYDTQNVLPQGHEAFIGPEEENQTSKCPTDLPREWLYSTSTQNLNFHNYYVSPTTAPVEESRTSFPDAEPMPRVNITSNNEQSKRNHNRTNSPPCEFYKNRNNKKKQSRGGKVYEFILSLLHDNSTCPSLIKWENRDEGTFKFVDNSAVAKLWGQRSNNPTMDYSKLSRAMRYHYKRNNLVSVPEKRLVYKFGSNVKGWRISV